MAEVVDGGYDVEHFVPSPSANGHGAYYDDPRNISPGHSAEAPRKPFPILHVDDLEIGDDPTWLIEGLLPATGFGIVFGPPKSLKSFLLADALFHVAMGRSWAGRTVMQGVVVYITGEGIEGFKRRLIAMRRHYGVEGQRVPFLMIPVAPDLGHASGDDATLVQNIRDYLASMGNPPVRAVAIDTVARTMKGADENAAKDVTVFVDNCERIGSELSCIVLGVHHAGKDTAKGARGSNALDGAVDVMWAVEKGEGSSTATIHHMKDAEAGANWQFRLEPVVLREATATSQIVAAAVVEMIALPGQAQQGATKLKREPIGARPTLLLKILREAMRETGFNSDGNGVPPVGARTVSREDVKRYLPIRGYWDDDKTAASNRAIYSADLKILHARNWIGLSNKLVWFGEGQS
jgi:hypothetical protein